MRINHNITALNTYRQLTINNTAANKSLEKLSSGYRINRAGDDAAGLAISEKMRGQIRGLNQAERNAQDAISLIQTAEGALNETHSILQRMRELAVQAASDTNTDDDRGELQEEIGYTSNKLTYITKIYTSPGFADEKIYIFKAEELVKSERIKDDDEFINICRFKPGEAFEMIKNGTITDAKTIVALLSTFKL